MEKNIKENICVYELNHLAVYQKVTQHGKPATILEKDTDERNWRQHRYKNICPWIGKIDVKMTILDFPGRPEVENPPANLEDTV